MHVHILVLELQLLLSFKTTSQSQEYFTILQVGKSHHANCCESSEDQTNTLYYTNSQICCIWHALTASRSTELVTVCRTRAA